MTTISRVDSTAEPRSGRTLIIVQCALVAVYVAAIGVALARAASFSGHLYLPHQGDEYTGNAHVWPGAWQQVKGLPVFGLAVAPYVAAATVLAAISRLRTCLHRRSLIVGTVLGVLVVASSLTTPVAMLRGWVLD